MDNDETLVMQTPSDGTRRRLFVDEGHDAQVQTPSPTPRLGLVELGPPMFQDDEPATPKRHEAVGCKIA